MFAPFAHGVRYEVRSSHEKPFKTFLFLHREKISSKISMQRKKCIGDSYTRLKEHGLHIRLRGYWKCKRICVPMQAYVRQVHCPNANGHGQEVQAQGVHRLAHVLDAREDARAARGERWCDGKGSVCARAFDYRAGRA